MRHARQARVTQVLDTLKAKLTELDQPLLPEKISAIRSEAAQFHESLTTMPHLDNPHWREIHGMVCQILTRTANTVPGGGRSRANQ